MTTRNMTQEIARIKKDAHAALAAVRTVSDLENVRIAYVGKKGLITEILKQMKGLSPDERREVGKAINVLKNDFESEIRERRLQYEKSEKERAQYVDVSLPGRRNSVGKRHPISQTIEEISRIFREIGFQAVDEREVETERYNFTILNIPLDHPARDGFDTFYTSRGALLRSQTSTAQGRIMERFKPPLAVISYGKVYRPDTVDACHSFMFHQMEGFLVDRNVAFSDLKGVLHLFAKKFFGKDTNIRFRPHFFPFTEPSVEVDVTCFSCHGKGCPVCSRSGWIEILGAGSIDPAVFEQVGYDPAVYTGFAFGLGIERICMLKNAVHDIRYFYENNLHFLRQF